MHLQTEKSTVATATKQHSGACSACANWAGQSQSTPDSEAFDLAAEHEYGELLITVQYAWHRDASAFARLACKPSAIELSLTLP